MNAKRGIHAPPLECWGRAKEALEVYRRRIDRLKEEANSRGTRVYKPDMIAYKELRSDWTPPRKHGEVEGVPIGFVLQGKGEAAILGIHQNILSGIDAKDPKEGKACYAVALSGGYADDDDTSEANGTIYYTGEGGQKKGIQDEDQDRHSPGNAALLLSFKTGLPIRVLKKIGKSVPPRYRYLGLYKCIGYTYEPGIHGKKIFRFTLSPLLSVRDIPEARALPPVPALAAAAHETDGEAEEHEANAELFEFKIPRKSMQPQSATASAMLLAKWELSKPKQARVTKTSRSKLKTPRARLDAKMKKMFRRR